MAKKASTINIEQIFWDEIAEYMERNEISNRNTAIEFMLLERKTMLNSQSARSNTDQRDKKSIQKQQLIKENNQDDIIGDAIGDVFEGLK